MKKTFYIFALMAFVSSFCQGEDLTTLDGKIYTNITEVTKYPKMIVFSFNGNREPVRNTNLPEAFRDKYRIVIATNAPPQTIAAPQQSSLSPNDALLFEHKDTELFECDSVNNTNDDKKSWQICLHGVEVTLTSYSDITDSDNDIRNYIKFQIGQEAIINQVFSKYFEWDAIATTNNAQPFTKVISYYRDLMKATLYPTLSEFSGDDTQLMSFNWSFNRSYVSDSLNGGLFYNEDVKHFQELLKELPTLKEKLANDIRQKEAQKELFK
jgi:hypothetical protein